MSVDFVVERPKFAPLVLDSLNDSRPSKRLLVVEDDPKLIQVLKRGLAEQGFEVLTAGTGPEGIERALSSMPEVILLDLMLPGKDGFVVLEELRTRGFDRPVILMTGRSQADDASRGIALGASDFLHKPFSFQELLARLHVLLRGPSSDSDGILRLEDLEMNLAAERVTRGGRVLELTTLEFSFLEYLLKNKGLILTRTMIQNHLWGSHYSGGTKLVDVYIRQLMAKVDVSGSPSLIHEVQDGGFVLKAAG